MLANISDSLQISYERVGNPTSRKIIFLHAFPLSSAMWRPQMALFSSQFDCIAPDARGIGDSTPFETRPTFKMMADDLNALLENLHITEKVTLCGLSMGGYCIFEFLRSFSEKVEAIVLCDTRADADSETARKGRNEMLEFSLRNSSAAVAEKMIPKLLGKTTRNENQKIAVIVKDLTASTRPEHLAATIQALRDRRDSTDLLPQIQVPTLVICGEEDEVTPPTLMRNMAAEIRGAQFVEIEKSGHLSNLENESDFNMALQKFLV